MAKKGGFVRRFVGFLAVLGIVGLVIVYSLLTGWKLLPDVGKGATNFYSSLTALSKPAPAWQTSVGDQPATAVATGDEVLVVSDSGVEAHRMSNGDKSWQRAAAWVGFGGDDNDVVIAGRTGRHGYDAVDADTGAVKWSNDSAIGVWTYTDLIIDLACPRSTSCDLTARSPQSGSVRWKTQLSGSARTLTGVNRTLAEPRPFGDTAEPPRSAPPLLGLPVGNQVQVVASANGRLLHTYAVAKDARIVVAGDRVVVSTVVPRDGSCSFSVQGRDPDGDRQVWQRTGYDLGTSSGVGCEQHGNPVGGDGLLDAVGPDNREVLLDDSTGGPAYRLAAGESLVAVDGSVALVRTAGGDAVRAVRLGGGSTLWTRSSAKSVKVDFASGVVLFTDSGANRLVALSSEGSTLFDVNSGATLLGYAEDGLVIHIGLRVGLVSYGSGGSGR